MKREEPENDGKQKSKSRHQVANRGGESGGTETDARVSHDLRCTPAINSDFSLDKSKSLTNKDFSFLRK